MIPVIGITRYTVKKLNMQLSACALLTSVAFGHHHHPHSH